MKTFGFILGFFLMVLGVQAQDVIVKKNGKEIHCKITREDSLTYYLIIPNKTNGYKTYINKSDVQSVKLGSNPDAEQLNIEPVSAFDDYELDLIFSKSGRKISGIITGEDSTHYFVTTQDGENVKKGHVNKSDVKHIQYNYLTKAGVTPSYCLTVGFLEGGGSLIGADIEFKVSETTGLQVGAGFLGFGAGVNFHIKPTLNSSAISLQYWHQGIGAATTQEIASANYVFRGKSILTAQIGLGAALSKGPAFPENREQPSFMLTYAVGIRFPW